MIRTRLTGLLLLALSMGLGGRARAQSAWQFPITADTMNEVGDPSSTVNIGAGPVATDGWDGPVLEPESPSAAGALVSIRSLHNTRELGYEGLAGPTALFQTDLRAPIGPGDPPEVWRLSVTYYGTLPSVQLNLSWRVPDSVPANVALKIGTSTDIQRGGGTDMRTTGTFTVALTPGSDNEIDVSASNTTPSAPFITITPSMATIAVGAPLILTAMTTNSSGSLTWASDGGEIVVQVVNAIAFTARQARTYKVTATVQGANGGSASATAIITAISTQLPPPTLTSFTPAQGPVGTHVLIAGTGFDPNPSGNAVYFSGSSSPAAVDNSTASTTQLNVTVPFDAVTGPIRITTPNGTATSASSFTVIPTQSPQTLILETTPRVGAIHSIIRVQNQSTVQWTNTPSVLFNGVPAVVPAPTELAMDGLVSTSQTIYVKVPPGAQSGFVTALSNDGNGINLQTAKEFTVLKPPTILTIQPAFWDTTDPKTGSIVPTLKLIGSGFVEYPHPVGATEPLFRYTVDYNGLPPNDPAKYMSITGFEVTDTNSPLFGTGLTSSILVQLQPSVLTGPIHFIEEMLNPISGQYDRIGEATTPVFTVTKKPVITNFSPGEGQAGDPVVITGRNFDPSNPLNNTVLFNGLSSDGSSAVPFSAEAPVTSVSSDGTQITVNVPDNALTGLFSVTDQTATSPTPFSVLPSVTLVPGAGSIRAGGDPITLHAVIGGLPPGADRTILWDPIDPAAGQLTPAASDPTNTLLRTYTPPANVPLATDLVAGFPLVLHATTKYSAIGRGGSPISGHGQAKYTLLPSLGLTINRSAIVVPNAAIPASFYLMVSSAGGVDLSQIQWSITGDLLTNSFGPGTLSSTTGPMTSYTPPPGADRDGLMGAVQASIPSLTLSKEVPVTIHQPVLQILSNSANPVTQTSATINWSVFPGQQPPSYVEYGAQPSMYTGSVPNSLVGQGSSSTAGQAVLTGLSPNTQYYYRITASAHGYASVTAGGQFTTLPQNQPSGVVVLVTATSPTVPAGGTDLLTVQVVGATNQNVTWSVNGVPGGNTQVGTIASRPAGMAVYTAPVVAPVQPVQIVAASQADSTASASATIVVQPPLAVIAPASPSVPTGATVTLSFRTASSNAPVPNVIWQVREGDAWGTVDANGNYTAPAIVPDPPRAHVVATSNDDPRVTATDLIAIVPRPVVTVQPAESTHNSGDPVQFKAFDGQGNPVAGVTWLIVSPKTGGGALDPVSGLYTAPGVVVAPFDVILQAMASNGGIGQAVVHVVASTSPTDRLIVHRGETVALSLPLANLTQATFITGVLNVTGTTGALPPPTALTLEPADGSVTLTSVPEGPGLRVRILSSTPLSVDKLTVHGSLVIPVTAAIGDQWTLTWTDLRAVDGTGQPLAVQSRNLSLTVAAFPGDLDGDGRVDIGDAIIALEIVVGLKTPVSPGLLALADVAPKRTDGTYGDGSVALNDVVRILRRAIGLEPDPWP